MLWSKRIPNQGRRAATVMVVMGLALSGCAGVGGLASTGQTAVGVPKTDAGQIAANPGQPAAALSFTELYSQVNPSVVNVQVTVPTSTLGQSNQLPQLPGMPNESPFGNQAQPPVQQGQGSGFLFDNQRHIVTNYHVAGDASTIRVVYSDGTSAAATVVGADPNSDLAVLEVDKVPSGVDPLPLAGAENLAVGQSVVAIGNPFGLEGTMTTGIISGLGRTVPSQAQAADGSRFSIPEVIQTDAAINPGNSGGPLLDLQGEVVGVNTAIESSTGQSSGVGFAVPAATVARVVPVLIKQGSYAHPWLGIGVRDLTPSIAQTMGLPENTRGVLVQDVVADGPADKASLQASSEGKTVNGIPVQVGGDVIVSIDGHAIKDVPDLLVYLENHTSVGDQIQLKLLRAGKSINQSVTLQPRPTSGG
jgi:S1-C subfamily serine protease